MISTETPTRDQRPLRTRLRDSRLAATAADDRGRRVRLLDPVRMKDAPAAANPAAAARLAWAREEVKAGNFGLRMGLAMLLCWVLFPVLDESGAPAAVWGVVVPLWLVLVWQLNRLLARRGNAVRTRRVGSLLASHGLCPTCAYSLADLSPEADGCTVCPECGGAWRRELFAAGGPALPGSPRLSHTGWRRRLPRGLLRDDRRETHPEARLPPDELLGLPWSESQRLRLAAALEAARVATTSARRRLAAFQFAMGALYLGMSVWVVRMIIRVLTEWDTAWGGVPAMVIATVPIGMLAFTLGMAAITMLQARWILGSRGRLFLPKGSACLTRHGFCAACINDLTGFTPEPDGCTICPECGAAWRLSPATAESPANPP
jgi:hypothetical protein